MYILKASARGLLLSFPRISNNDLSILLLIYFWQLYNKGFCMIKVLEVEKKVCF